MIGSVTTSLLNAILPPTQPTTTTTTSSSSTTSSSTATSTSTTTTRNSDAYSTSNSVSVGGTTSRAGSDPVSSGNGGAVGKFPDANNLQPSTSAGGASAGVQALLDEQSLRAAAEEMREVTRMQLTQEKVNMAAEKPDADTSLVLEIPEKQDQPTARVDPVEVRNGFAQASQLSEPYQQPALDLSR